MDDDVKEALETIRRDILGGGTTLSYRAALVALATLEKALEAATVANAALVEVVKRWGFVRWDAAEDDPGDIPSTFVRCQGCGAVAVEPDEPKHKPLCAVGAALVQPHSGAPLLARLEPKHLGAVVLAIMDKRRRCVGGRLDGPEGIGAPLRQYLLTGEKP